MLEVLLWFTGFIVLAGMFHAYTWNKDPLHPNLISGPLFIFAYCASPLTLMYNDRLERFFPEPAQLEYVALISVLSIFLFILGLNRKSLPITEDSNIHDTTPHTPLTTNHLRNLGIFMGTLGILSYAKMTMNAGGLIQAYSHSKGGGSAGSGYIGEGPLLVYPAIFMIALAMKGKKLSIGIILLILTVASPQLIHGTLGGRRGPLFLILITLLLAWITIRNKRPSFATLAIMISTISFIVLAVWANRKEVFIGSGQKIEISRITDKLLPDPISTSGHFYVYGAGAILTSRHHQDFYWGKRYAVTLIVRPIPKQFWPTKYEDTMGEETDSSKRRRWKDAMGWDYLSGSACGIVADSYMEFGLGCLMICYLMGSFLNTCWRKHRTEGGFWSIFYSFVCILGIYIPTQSLSAFWHRLLFMSIPTAIIWRFYIDKTFRFSLVVTPPDTSEEEEEEEEEEVSESQL